MAKLLVMYPRPKDEERFKRVYREVHIPLCKKMPGIGNISYGYPTAPKGEEPFFFCVFIAEFDSIEAIEDAFASPEGKEVTDDIPNYSPDHYPTMLFMDSIEA